MHLLSSNNVCGIVSVHSVAFLGTCFWKLVEHLQLKWLGQVPLKLNWYLISCWLYSVLVKIGPKVLFTGMHPKVIASAQKMFITKNLYQSAVFSQLQKSSLYIQLVGYYYVVTVAGLLAFSADWVKLQENYIFVSSVLELKHGACSC